MTRLVRMTSPEEVSQLAAAVCTPSVLRHLFVRFAEDEPLSANARRWAQQFESSWARRGFGGVGIVADSSVVGFVSIKTKGEAPHEIYFALGESAQGRGLGHAALSEFMKSARGALDRAPLRASLDPNNQPALRLLLKLGFVYEGPLDVADFAGAALAKGSLELALRWAETSDRQRFEEAARRAGQLARAAGASPRSVTRALISAAAPHTSRASLATEASLFFELGARTPYVRLLYAPPDSD